MTTVTSCILILIQFEMIFWWHIQTAIEIAKRGGIVHLVCRNPDSAEEAKKEIVELTSNQNVHIHILDLANLKSVHQVYEIKHRCVS